MEIAPSRPSVVQQVRKRDGVTLQSFDVYKIREAVRKAWQSVNAPAERLDAAQADVVWAVEVALRSRSGGAGVADVEEIQNLVEFALMRVNPVVAKHYVLYRQKRTEARSARRHPDPLAVSDYIHAGKYARYRPELSRREVYLETVARDEAMHLKKFPHFAEEIRNAFDLVREKWLLPSMRSMQFGGRAIEVVNNRIYNCSATLIDRPRAFAEALYLLMCGCGVGYSVQFEHVDKLPHLHRIDERRVIHHTVNDNIEGWAEALNALVNSYLGGDGDGRYVEFDYALVRGEGAALKTSGGKAPGHLPLKRALEHVRDILHNAEGRKLRPIECHDILCHSADMVLSGGIRRSAMISLFSLEDSEMMYAKTGNWHDKTPWRENANNSVMLLRGEVREKIFKRIFQMTREWGEPGFEFCDSLDYAFNPCSEIGLNPVLTITDEVLAMLARRERRGKKHPPVKLGETYTGYAFCNLTEINGAKIKSLGDFRRVASAAAFIGTLQAAYTDMAYLGWVSEVIAEREALIGVGMTGMLDSPEIVCDPENQRVVAALVVETNRDWAERLGVRPAARATTVKPSGTTSLELGCVGSGHHPHHARRYIRRVVANEIEAVFQHFRSINPHMCVKKPDGDWVIEFPVEAPEGALLKEAIGAIQFLEMVKSTQQNWVLPGTARPESSPGLTHNVSTTVHVRPEEWIDVADYLFDNRALFAGVSFLAVRGDKDFAFAPFEAVITEADEARWNQLIAEYKPIDYTQLVETEDTTNLTQEAACVAGACEVVR